MYVLDAPVLVFIPARNLHDGFDFRPAFWSWLENADLVQRVFSIQNEARFADPASGHGTIYLSG